MGVNITGTLATKFSTDVYPTHSQELGQGAYRSVASTTELFAIPVERRRLLMMVAVRNYGGDPALLWLDAADNTPAQLGDNNNWKEVTIGATVQGGVTFRGFVSMADGSTTDGFTISDNPLNPPSMGNGWFWIVEVAGTYDFGSGNITANINDWIIYDGTYLRKLSQTSVASWNTLADRPQILLDIVDGTIVYGTQTWVDSQIASQYAVTQAWVNSRIATSEANTQSWVIANYYNKTEIDDLLATGAYWKVTGTTVLTGDVTIDRTTSSVSGQRSFYEGTSLTQFIGQNSSAPAYPTSGVHLRHSVTGDEFYVEHRDSAGDANVKIRMIASGLELLHEKESDNGIVKIGVPKAQWEFRNTGTTANYVMLNALNGAGTESIQLLFDLDGSLIDGVTFVDGRATTRGMEYFADYSADFTLRSLVDKGYVDYTTNQGIFVDVANEIDSVVLPGLSSPVRSIKPRQAQAQGQITLTNGSSAIAGVGTNFTNTDPADGLSFWYQLWVVDSNNDLYRIMLSSVTDDTTATMDRCYTRAAVEAGYTAAPPTTFQGVTGTYDFVIVEAIAEESYSMAAGNQTFAKNYSTAIGGSAVAVGQTSFATGLYGYASGNQSFVAGGAYARAEGNQSFAGGYGYSSVGKKGPLAGGVSSFAFFGADSNQTTGHGALGNYSAILGGFNSNVPSDSLRSVVIGGNTIKATAATPDTVFLPKLRIGQGTGATITQDDTAVQIAVIDAITGEIKWRASSTLGGGGGGSASGPVGSIQVSDGASGFIHRAGNTIDLSGNLVLTGGITFDGNLAGTDVDSLSLQNTAINHSLALGTGITDSYWQLISGTVSSSVILTLSLDPGNELATGTGIIFGIIGTAIVGYEADYSSNYTDRSFIDRGYANATYTTLTYANTHLASKDVSALMQAPGAPQDKFITYWDNATSKYDIANLSSLLTAGDGLTYTSGVISLGDTSIDGNIDLEIPSTATGDTITLKGGGEGATYPYAQFRIHKNASANALSRHDNAGYGQMHLNSNGTTYTDMLWGWWDGTLSGFSFRRTGVTSWYMQVIDSINSRGLEYGADYSSNFTTRSLVDKGYADTKWPLSGTGILTGNVVIDVATNNVDLQFDTAGDGFGTGASSLWLLDAGGIQLDSYEDTDTFYSRFDLYNADITVLSTLSGFKGITYNADWSANFVARSLVDKAYVDSLTVTNYWKTDADTTLSGNRVVTIATDTYLRIGSHFFTTLGAGIYLDNDFNANDSYTVRLTASNSTRYAYMSMSSSSSSNSVTWTMTDNAGTYSNIFTVGDPASTYVNRITGTVIKSSGNQYFNNYGVTDRQTGTADLWILSIDYTDAARTSSGEVLFTRLTSGANIIWSMDVEGLQSMRSLTAPSGDPPTSYGYLFHDTSDNRIKWKYGSTTYDLTTGGVTAFDSLTDTPANKTGSNSYLVRVNAGASALEYVDGTTLYASASHTHLLAAGATDVTATAAEVNLLDLAGLTVGWVLSADSATTASWKAPTGGGGSPGGSDGNVQYNNGGVFGGFGNWDDTNEVLRLDREDATTNTTFEQLILRQSCSATPVAGFGNYMSFELESSTTTGREAGKITTKWTNATDASRVSQMSFSVWYISTENVMLFLEGGANPYISMNYPMRFKGYGASSLPTAGVNDQGFVYVTDEEKLAYSNGTDWLRIGLYNGGFSTQNLSTYALNCNGQEQYIESIKTNKTTSTWTISNIDKECLLYVYMTDSTGTKTLTIQITGERLIDVNNKVVASSATQTVVLTIPSGADYLYEILITDTGHTYSTDKIYHVSLV
jgi:hypothetical protein